MTWKKAALVTQSFFNKKNGYHPLPCDCEVRGHCLSKEKLVIPVKRVVDKKKILRKNGGPKERRKRLLTPPPKKKNIYDALAE
jgi:hypothetical protein